MSLEFHEVVGDEPPAKTDNELMLEAIKELTAQVSKMKVEVCELKEEWTKWRKAGKF